MEDDQHNVTENILIPMVDAITPTFHYVLFVVKSSWRLMIVDALPNKVLSSSERAVGTTLPTFTKDDTDN